MQKMQMNRPMASVALVASVFVGTFMGLGAVLFESPLALADSASYQTISTEGTGSMGGGKKVSGQWRLRIQGRHFSEKQNNFSGTEFAFLSKLEYLFHPKIRFKLNSKIGFKNDHVQLEYRDEYSSGHFQIYEAVAGVAPWPYLSLEAGVIGQNQYSSPIFISGRSLPGIRETFTYKVGIWTFFLQAQQALATAKSFSADRSESEKTPFLNRELLGMEIEVAPGWSFKSYASHFNFDNLASVTAADGSKLGHFTLGSGAAAKFRYGFAGWTAQTELDYQSSSGAQILLGGFWLKNKEAQLDGLGQSLYLQSKFPVGVRHKWSLSYTHFFKEREAAPAVFSSLSLGGNNRMGQLWGTHWSFEDMGFKLVGRFAHVDVIKKSEGGRRGKARSYYLGLETLNVKF